MTIEGLELDPNNIPYHVAIIMDGNRRWAEKRHLPALEGHRRGLERVIDVLNVSEEIGVKAITLYAFSVENWKRSTSEVNGLMNLFRFFFKREFRTIKKKNIKVLHSGLKDSFSQDIQKIIDTMVQETENNTSGILNLAINYSGRSELVEGVKNIIKNGTSPDAVTEELISLSLFHPELPDPDLLIRTSGEQRISNFLLWQCAYTELYFTDILWPEFGRRDFAQAILDYQNRERRFGGRI